jgi:anti-anti-sigma factor
MGTKTCLEIAREGEVAIVSFTSNCICDVTATAKAATQLSEYIEAHAPRRMVFDFSGVAIVSSLTLSLLLDTRARLEPHHGEVVIAALSEQLRRVFALAKLDNAFTFCPDRASAVKMPREPGSGASLGG